MLNRKEEQQRKRVANLLLEGSELSRAEKPNAWAFAGQTQRFESIQQRGGACNARIAKLEHDGPITYPMTRCD